MCLKCALCSSIILENRSIRSGLSIGRYSRLNDTDHRQKNTIGTSLIIIIIIIIISKCISVV